MSTETYNANNDPRVTCVRESSEGVRWNKIYQDGAMIGVAIKGKNTREWTPLAIVPGMAILHECPKTEYEGTAAEYIVLQVRG